jgi:hypothetical protein
MGRSEQITVGVLWKHLENKYKSSVIYLYSTVKRIRSKVYTGEYKRIICNVAPYNLVGKRSVQPECSYFPACTQSVFAALPGFKDLNGQGLCGEIVDWSGAIWAR